MTAGRDAEPIQVEPTCRPAVMQPTSFFKSHKLLDDLPWRLWLVAAFSIAFSVSLCMSWSRLPAPSCHDEFSNLLVADTLLHGRLANPSPEIWQPFQSFHVLVNPAYASKFPLGPGALLALGWLIFGTPAAGIWLGAGLCAACVTWAAAGCMPRRWAAVAGLLLALHPDVHHQWSLSFMNGWLTATSAALVAGAALRLRKRMRAIDCVLVGLGVSGLAVTRPFEGVVFTASAAGLLLYWWRRETWLDQARSTCRVAAWAATPLVATFGIMMVHNRLTTGHVWQLPYQLHELQYGVAPLSIFQAPKEPLMTEWSADVPPTIRAFHYGWSLDCYFKRNSLTGWCGAVAERLHVVVKLWGLAFCLLTASMLFQRTGGHRPISLMVGLALLVGSFVPWFFSHYFAPSLVWMVILTTLAIRWSLTQWMKSLPVRAAVVALLFCQAMFVVIELQNAHARPMTWADERQDIVNALTEQGGSHLILVRYHQDHNVHHEWVYNGADLEHNPVVWARSWRPDFDARLMAHYAGRQVWVLEFDERDHPLPLIQQAR